MLESHGARRAVPYRQRHIVRSFRELHCCPESAVISDQKYAVSHLGHAVEHRIDKRVPRRVADRFQGLSYPGHDIVPAEIQDFRHILDKNRKRLRGPDIVQVAQVQIGPRIDRECARVFGDLAQLGPADPRIGLARRSSDDDVEGIGDRTQI